MVSEKFAVSIFRVEVKVDTASITDIFLPPIYQSRRRHFTEIYNANVHYFSLEILCLSWQREYALISLEFLCISW